MRTSLALACMLAAGMAGAALAPARAALQTPDRSRAEALYDQGWKHQYAGAYDRAVSAFAQALALDPKFAKAYNGRGNAYAGKRDYRRAIADYSKAISLDPHYAAAYLNRGAVYHRKGERELALRDYDRAISESSRAIARNARDVEALLSRGFAYASKRDYRRALADLDRALKLDPSGPLAYVRRAYTYLYKKDYDRAIADFNMAIVLNLRHADIYAGRGFAYHQKGDYDEAISDYSEALALDPKAASTYFNRALAYDEKHEFESALADYRKALALEPDNRPACHRLADLYAYYSSWPEAVKTFRELYRAAPSSPARRYLLWAQAHLEGHSVFGFTLLFQRTNETEWRPAFGWASTFQGGVLIWSFMLFLPPYLAWQVDREIGRRRRYRARLVLWALALWLPFALVSVLHRFLFGSCTYLIALSALVALALAWLVLGVWRIVLPAARMPEEPKPPPEERPEEYEPPVEALPPPPPVPRWTANPSPETAPVRLCRMPDPTAAEIIRANLTQAGIPSVMHMFGALTGELARVADGVTSDYAIILVPRNRLEEARALLADLESGPVTWPAGMEPDEEDKPA